MKSALYRGHVYHKRRRPKTHVLRYRVFSLLLNLEEVQDLSKRIKFFSHNRWNLFSFYDTDHGEEKTESLRSFVSRKLRSAGITEQASTIMLSCYPRVCGYTFNPLSVFYCLNADGKAFAILHEVNNTFGERHVYVLPVEEENDERIGSQSSTASDALSGAQSLAAAQNWINQAADKALFVSPFTHMNMHYKFRLNVPGEKQVVVVKAYDEDGPLLTASYTANRQSFNTSTLLRYFFVFPALTVKITLGIHFEAFLLFVKKVPGFAHQSKQSLSSNNLKNP